MARGARPADFHGDGFVNGDDDVFAERRTQRGRPCHTSVVGEPSRAAAPGIPGQSLEFPRVDAAPDYAALALEAPEARDGSERRPRSIARKTSMSTALSLSRPTSQPE